MPSFHSLLFGGNLRFEKNMNFPISDSWSFSKQNFGLIEKG